MARGKLKQDKMLKRARSQRMATHMIEDRILLRNIPALRAIRARTRGNRRT